MLLTPPLKEVFFGLATVTPLWEWREETQKLLLTCTESDQVRVFCLHASEVAAIRSMSGVTSSAYVQLGEDRTQVVLVGRRSDTGVWAGTAAPFVHTPAVSAALESGLAFAERVVSEVNSLVVILDAKGKIRRFNRLCEEATGIREEDLVGKDAHNLFIPDSDREASRVNVQSFFSGKDTHEVLRPIMTKRGERLIHWRNKLIHSGSGIQETFLVCSGTDVTEEHQAKARLTYLANTDALTDLPNRHFFEQSIGKDIRDEPERPFGLIFLDMDNFKTVNDHYGHLVGDELLRLIAKAVKLALGDDMLVARQGGDEFLIKVPGASAETLVDTAIRILDCLRTPFSLPHALIYTSCSMGLSLYPEHGDTLEELIRRADTAMYVAKDEGRHRHKIFHISMDEKIQKDLWLSINMRKGLEDEQFELYYQPKVDLLSGTIRSVEALVRWRHPERGVISPIDFIPYAEASGLIIPLGRWVFQQAALRAAQWRRQGHPLRVAVNLSACQFMSPTLLIDFKEALAAAGPGPCLLDVEITETALIEDEIAAVRLLNGFKKIGAEIHLDDFGTGYSSFSQLTRLPLDVLKLEGSFIKSLCTDKRSQALVRAMATVSRELGMRIVAECVETAEQSQHLSALGVNYGQGFLFGRPTPASECEHASVFTGRESVLAGLQDG